MKGEVRSTGSSIQLPGSGEKSTSQHCRRGYRLDFFELCSDQPSSPSLGKLLLGLFSGQCPANARALIRIDEYAGDRPKPAVTGRAACLPHKGPDNSLAAHNDQVLVTRLPVGSTKLIGGSAKTKGHGPRLRGFGH